MTLHRRGTALAVAAVVAAAAAAPIVTPQPVAALVELPMDVGGFQDGVYVPLDDVLLGESGGAAVVANGNLALTWSGSELDTRARRGRRARVVGVRPRPARCRHAGSARCAAGEFDEVLEVLEVPLGSFPAGPAEVTPHLGLNVRISGAAQAGAQLSVVAPFDVGAAIDKEEAGHAVTSTGRPRFQPEIGLPDAADALAFQVSVELELTMSFMMSISDIPVGGPVLAASFGARLEVDLGAADWWVLQGLAGLQARLVMAGGRRITAAAGAGGAVPPASSGASTPRTMTGPPSEVSTRWSRSFGIHNGDDAGAIVADGDELAIVERDNSGGGHARRARQPELAAAAGQPRRVRRRQRLARRTTNS